MGAVKMKFNCKCPECNKRFQKVIEVNQVTPSMVNHDMVNGFIYKECIDHERK